MTRGRLRVMLGAAPGVGKTYAMLEEGRRLGAAGRDVAVGVVETHGRAATAALTDGLEIVPRRHVVHRGVDLEDLDLDAILTRAPEIALVDELAHTNAPGSAHAKRWEDVEVLLAAGIDVITTVNVQHMESLRDVVRQITGITQGETVPDRVVRSADEIELVDLAPESLQGRLREGVVYPPARIDAALSNYFRLGNLTALRELALLWLADEVDSALRRYRAEKGIDAAWTARERIVVALTGGPEGETLIRRGARIASRASAGELFAVHVARPDGLLDTDPARLDRQRELVESLGGSFHHVVGDHIARSLVEFARSVDATQLVVGVSRRGAIARLLGGPGTAATVIREAGDIDVHVVSHAEAGRPALPRLGGSLSPRRRWAGLALAVLGLPLLTALLAATRGPESMTSDVLTFQLFIVVVALVGGIWPAVGAAVASGLLLDYFFVDPLYTVTISDPLHLLALVIFVIVAVLVSIVVDLSARRGRLARRAAAESAALARIAGSVLEGQDAVQALVNQLRESLGLTSVLLRSPAGVEVASVDPSLATDDDVESTTPLGAGATLSVRGRALPAADRRILQAFLSQLGGAVRQRELSREAETMRPLAEADRLRTALLAAVGHDLRRPLAAATAAVTALRSTDVRLDPDDVEELLGAADESLRVLADLVTKLLDASRLQAGVLGVELAPVALDDAVSAALDELGVGPADVELDLETAAPTVTADRVLLVRAIVNLLTNALRFSPAGRPPVLATSAFGGRGQVRVIDVGPGIDPADRAEVFLPFRRPGDTDPSTGVGLGLSLSRGFVEAMGGSLDMEDTPGGGVTMVIDLPLAPPADRAADAGPAAPEPVERET